MVRLADGIGFVPASDGELRDWYAGTLDQLAGLAPGAVLQSFMGRFMPALRRLKEPPPTEAVEAFPDRFTEWEGVWYAAIPDLADAEWPDPEAHGEVFNSGAGFAIRTPQGRIIRDREEALRWARLRGKQLGEVPPFVAAITKQMPSGRRPGVSLRTGKRWRRGVDPANLARALAFVMLARNRGQRESARIVIRWDADLGGPLADATAAGAVERFDLGDLRGDTPALENSTQQVLRDVYRVLDAIIPAA